MMRKSPGVIGVSILTALLAASSTACEGRDDGGKRPVPEWEVLTSEAMKLYRSGDLPKGLKLRSAHLKSLNKMMAPTIPMWP